MTCLGNALSYALTDHDLTATISTFAAHAHNGTLLVVDPLNAHTYLGSDGFQERFEATVDTPEFKATSVSVHELDRTAQLLRRTRTGTSRVNRMWRITRNTGFCFRTRSSGRSRPGGSRCLVCTTIASSCPRI